jgi:NADPH:quinone reductase-like Zn-dependent oxidoreductase
METMKAVVCTNYGPPDVLELREVDRPVPKDNEVLIKIHATTVSAADFRVRSFTVPLSFWLPARLALGVTKPRRAILGNELAGTIESVGSNVTQFRKGDEVFAATGHHFGAYAQYICLSLEMKEVAVAMKPANLTFEEAAAIPFGGITALRFMREASIQKGQAVLIYGASGSVGTYAVQLARYFGGTVTAVCSTSNVELVKSLGADRVIDYTKEDFTKRAEKYDVIFDTVGKGSISGCVRSLKDGGVFLHAVATPAVSIRLRWASMTSNKRMIGGTALEKSEDLTMLKDLAEEGHIRPVIDRRYRLEQIVEAHRYVDKGHKKGNVVITLEEKH